MLEFLLLQRTFMRTEQLLEMLLLFDALYIGAYSTSSTTTSIILSRTVTITTETTSVILIIGVSSGSSSICRMV